MKKLLASLFLITIILTACSGEEENKDVINIAGSSTVYPITSEAIYQYELVNDHIPVNLESTGTGGGFELFTKGETDINNASRPIKEEEINDAKENGISYTELLLGTDGISVIVNPENDWIDDITVEELKMIFENDSTVQTWSDVREEWPDEKINLFGPTSASGTYDFFCEEVVEEEGDDGCAIRGDMNGTENDNEVISNVSNDEYGIGFLGYAFYQENKDAVKALAINGTLPEPHSIKNGDYYLSRPLYIYVNNNNMKSSENLNKFVTFYMDGIADYVEVAGYVPLDENQYEEQRAKLT